MITHYSRHSLKMFIRGKPVGFGYKYWVFASATGYCYFYIPYTGVSANADYDLGENVVLRMLENISDPTQYNVTFDNFFTSHKLLYILTQKEYFPNIGKRGRCGQCGGETEYGCTKYSANLHPKNCFAQFYAGTPKNIDKIKKSKL